MVNKPSCRVAVTGNQFVLVPTEGYQYAEIS